MHNNYEHIPMCVSSMENIYIFCLTVYTFKPPKTNKSFDEHMHTHTAYSETRCTVRDDRFNSECRQACWLII